MKTSSTIYKILFIVAFIPFVVQAQDNLHDYNTGTVCSNYVNITGKSNVNRFEFRLNFPSDEIFSVNNSFLTFPSNKKVYEISIPVKNFQASNNLLYQDFLTLLKENIHPRIIIGIGSKQLRNFLDCETFTDQQIKITLAGITKEYSVPCIVNSCSNDLIYVSGYKNIRLTDFNLEPPEKFQGLVKVKDEVIINFGFVFAYKD